MNWIHKMANWISGYYCKVEIAENEKLLSLLEQNQTLLTDEYNKVANISKRVEDLSSMNSFYMREIDKLEKQMSDNIEEEELEKFWNNKRPKVDFEYKCRPLFNSDYNIEVDPRVFFQPEDSIIPSFYNIDQDKAAIDSLDYVHKKVKYTGDWGEFKIAEAWLYPYETLFIRKGDCEDGAILLANIMLKSGISYWGNLSKTI